MLYIPWLLRFIFILVIIFGARIIQKHMCNLAFFKIIMSMQVILLFLFFTNSFSLLDPPYLLFDSVWWGLCAVGFLAYYPIHSTSSKIRNWMVMVPILFIYSILTILMVMMSGCGEL
ncbi:hypothetical protein ACEN4P_10445 [Marinilactibacillus psychrotolerans]|uniref:hypothetical protein n=1 Tax=Marinilactibacillus psychrotolerans TaxID=191770 RepID=UPI00186891AC|nr:hypothetical protein [Marinilactibacillus psychrotolerans]